MAGYRGFPSSSTPSGAASGDLSGTYPSPSVASNAITVAKMADLATDRLLGRDTAGTGDPEALTVSGGLEFSGSGGIQRSALTGDVTASAGSGVTTVAKVNGVTPSAFILTLLDDADATTARATLSAARAFVWTSTKTSTDSPYTASVGQAVPVSTVTDVVTVKLPASPSAGDNVRVSDVGGNASVKNITIDGNGHTINGGASHVIPSNYGSRDLSYTGSVWVTP